MRQIPDAARNQCDNDSDDGERDCSIHASSSYETAFSISAKYSDRSSKPHYRPLQTQTDKPGTARRSPRTSLLPVCGSISIPLWIPDSWSSTAGESAWTSSLLIGRRRHEPFPGKPSTAIRVGSRPGTLSLGRLVRDAHHRDDDGKPEDGPRRHSADQNRFDVHHR